MHSLSASPIVFSNRMLLIFSQWNRKYPRHKTSSFCFDPPTVYPTSHLGFNKTIWSDHSHTAPYYAGLMLTADPVPLFPPLPPPRLLKEFLNCFPKSKPTYVEHPMLSARVSLHSLPQQCWVCWARLIWGEIYPSFAVCFLPQDNLLQDIMQPLFPVPQQIPLKTKHSGGFTDSVLFLFVVYDFPAPTQWQGYVRKQC